MSIYEELAAKGVKFMRRHHGTASYGTAWWLRRNENGHWVRDTELCPLPAVPGGMRTRNRAMDVNFGARDGHRRDLEPRQCDAGAFHSNQQHGRAV